MDANERNTLVEIWEALGLAPETSNLMVIEEIKRVKAQASQFNRDRIALGYAVCDALGIDGSQLPDEAIVNQVKAVKAYGDDGERFTKQVAEVLGVDWGTSRQSTLIGQIKRLKDGQGPDAVAARAKDEILRELTNVFDADLDTMPLWQIKGNIKNLKENVKPVEKQRDNYKSRLDKAQKELIQAEAVDRFERNVSTQIETIETPAERLLWSLMGQLADNLSNAEAKTGLEAIVKNLIEEIKTK